MIYRRIESSNDPTFNFSDIRFLVDDYILVSEKIQQIEKKFLENQEILFIKKIHNTPNSYFEEIKFRSLDFYFNYLEKNKEIETFKYKKSLLQFYSDYKITITENFI